MATPRHRNWYLEDFVKRSIHPDANVLCIGDSFRIPIQNICRQKGLQLRKKAGTPTIVEGGVLDFPDKSQDLVVFLNTEPSLDELRKAARISRMYVAVQRRGVPDLCALNDLGFKLVVTFLPLIAADDRGSDENPPVLYVLDVSQDVKETEPKELGYEESVGRLVAGFDDDVRAYLTKRFGVPELPPFNETMSYDEYGWVLLTAISSSESVGEFRDFEHFQTAVTMILVDFPNLASFSKVVDTQARAPERSTRISVHGSGGGDHSGVFIDPLLLLGAQGPEGAKSPVVDLPMSGPQGSKGFTGEAKPEKGPIPMESEFKVIRGSGVFKGTLDQFADVLSSNSGFEDLLSHPQVELMEEKYFPGDPKPPEGPSVHDSMPPADPVLDLARRSVSLEEQLLGRAKRKPLPDPFPLRDPANRLPVAYPEIGNYRSVTFFSREKDTDVSKHVFEMDFDDEPITEEEKSRGYSEKGWYFFEEMGHSSVQGPFTSREAAEQQCQEFQNTLDEIATLLGTGAFNSIHYAQVEKFPAEALEGPGYTQSGWYFVDETSSHVLGPYETKVAAARALFAYCESLEPKP